MGTGPLPKHRAAPSVELAGRVPPLKKLSVLMEVTLQRDPLAAPLVRQAMHAREALRQYVLAEPTRIQPLQSAWTALRATVALRPKVQQFARRGMRRSLTPPHVHLVALVHSPTATALFRVQSVLRDRTVSPSLQTQYYATVESKF